MFKLKKLTTLILILCIGVSSLFCTNSQAQGLDGIFDEELETSQLNQTDDLFATQLQNFENFTNLRETSYLSLEATDIGFLSPDSFLLATRDDGSEGMWDGGFIVKIDQDRDVMYNSFCRDKENSNFLPFVRITQNYNNKPTNKLIFYKISAQISNTTKNRYSCFEAYQQSQKTCYNDYGWTDGEYFILRNDFNKCEILLFKDD